MRLAIPLAAFLLFGGPFSASAQSHDSLKSQDSDKGTYLGVLFSAVPEVLYDQVPALPRGGGVVITHVLPDSPAAKGEILRHDILVGYGGEKVQDCEQLARLIQADKPHRKLKLEVFRAG